MKPRTLDRIAYLVIAIAVLALGAIAANAGEAKWHTNATAAAINFAPTPGGWNVDMLRVVSDTPGSVLTCYTRSAKTVTTAAPTNGQSAITVALGTGISSNDAVIYMHATGAIHYSLVTTNTATSVTLGTALTAAGAIGDAIYELGTYTIMSVGSNTVELTGGDIISIPGDSPARFTLTGTAAATGGAKLLINTDR